MVSIVLFTPRIPTRHIIGLLYFRRIRFLWHVVLFGTEAVWDMRTNHQYRASPDIIGFNIGIEYHDFIYGSAVFGGDYPERIAWRHFMIYDSKWTTLQNFHPVSNTIYAKAKRLVYIADALLCA